MIYPETLLGLSISWEKAIFFSPEEESSRRRDVARAFGVAADERCAEYKLIREFTNGNALYANCWRASGEVHYYERFVILREDFSIVGYSDDEDGDKLKAEAEANGPDSCGAIQDGRWYCIGCLGSCNLVDHMGTPIWPST